MFLCQFIFRFGFGAVAALGLCSHLFVGFGLVVDLLFGVFGDLVGLCCCG